MKEIVLVYSSSTPACKRMITNEDFLFALSELRSVIGVKIIRVDDEYTRTVLVRVGKPRIPFMIIDNGGEFQEVRGVSNILKSVADMRNLLESRRTPEEMLERLRDNVYWVSCSNYAKLGKKLLQAFIVLIHEDCLFGGSSYTTDKIADMVLTGDARAKYLIVASDKFTAEQCCKQPVAVTNKASVERLANEYKEAHSQFLAKK